VPLATTEPPKVHDDRRRRIRRVNSQAELEGRSKQRPARRGSHEEWPDSDPKSSMVTGPVEKAPSLPVTFSRNRSETAISGSSRQAPGWTSCTGPSPEQPSTSVASCVD